MNEELELVKLELENTNDMMDVKRNPVIESMLSPIKKIPYIGPLLNTAVEIKMSELQRQKENELIDVIMQNKYAITSEMVNDVEFIINFNRTLEAVRRLATGDKVKFFGNLVKNGYLAGRNIENSQFEEYLNILNSLSYREIEYLADFLIEASDKGGRILDESWNAFISKMNTKYNVKNILFWYKRLEATGFIREIVSSSEMVGNTLVLGDKSKGYEADDSLYEFYELVLKRDEK